MKLVLKEKNIRVKAMLLNQETLIYGCIIFVLSILLGRIQLFEYFTICGLAFCTACWITGLPYLFSLLGCMIGAFLCVPIQWNIICSALCLPFLAWLWKKWNKKIRIIDKLLLLALSQIIVIPVFFMANIKSCALGIAGVAICELLSVVFFNALKIERVSKEEQVLNDAEQISLCALVGMITLAFSDIIIWEISFAVIFAIIFVLLATYIKGVSGIAVAITIGAILSLNDQFSFALAGNLAVCALAGASCRTFGKYAIAAVSYLCMLVLGQTLGGQISTVSYLEGAIACILYIIIPQKFMNRLRVLMDIESFHNSQVEKSLLSYRHTFLSRIFAFQNALTHISKTAEYDLYENTEDRTINYFYAQLQGIQKATTKIDKLSREEIKVDTKAEHLLKQGFKKTGIYIQEISVFRCNDKMQILLKTSFKRPDIDLITRCIQNILRISITFLEKKDDYIWFESANTLSAKVGTAAIPLLDTEPSGDSFRFKELGNGKALIALSDGMGSGVDAKRISMSALDVLFDLYKANFSGESVYSCINQSLLFNNSNEIYATLDAVLLDYVNKTATFIKFGAPASYLIKRKEIITVYAESQPLGILSNVHTQFQTFPLERGDKIVLLTDGITETLKNNLEEEIISATNTSRTIQDAAKEILASAMLEGIADDMSVIAAEIV